MTHHPLNCEKYKQINPDAQCDCSDCIAGAKALTELREKYPPNSHEGEKKCECVCHFIYPVKRGEAFPRQFDRPIGCEHCTSQNSHEGEKKIKE